MATVTTQVLGAAQSQSLGGPNNAKAKSSKKKKRVAEKQSADQQGVMAPVGGGMIGPGGRLGGGGQPLPAAEAKRPKPKGEDLDAKIWSAF